MGARRDGRGRSRRCICGVDMWLGPKRVRVLRRVSGGPDLAHHGRGRSPGRTCSCLEGDGQGHVSFSVIVQKYGGTSVSSAARIRRVSRRIAATVAKGEQVVAVVSAMGHTTDRLISLAQSVNAEPPARELDMLVANGETITAPLVAMCLQGMGVPAVSLSGLQAGVRTRAHHSPARIPDNHPAPVLRTPAEGKGPAGAGFQAVTQGLGGTTHGPAGPGPTWGR